LSNLTHFGPGGIGRGAGVVCADVVVPVGELPGGLLEDFELLLHAPANEATTTAAAATRVTRVMAGSLLRKAGSPQHAPPALTGT
jgi:hypothetical protein